MLTSIYLVNRCNLDRPGSPFNPPPRPSPQLVALHRLSRKAALRPPPPPRAQGLRQLSAASRAQGLRQPSAASRAQGRREPSAAKPRSRPAAALRRQAALKVSGSTPSPTRVSQGSSTMGVPFSDPTFFSLEQAEEFVGLNPNLSRARVTVGGVHVRDVFAMVDFLSEKESKNLWDIQNCDRLCSEGRKFAVFVDEYGSVVRDALEEIDGAGSVSATTAHTLGYEAAKLLQLVKGDPTLDYFRGFAQFLVRVGDAALAEVAPGADGEEDGQNGDAGTDEEEDGQNGDADAEGDEDGQNGDADAEGEGDGQNGGADGFFLTLCAHNWNHCRSSSRDVQSTWSITVSAMQCMVQSFIFSCHKCVLRRQY